MQEWFSLSTLLGLSIALVYAAVAWRSLERGVFWYGILGAVPTLQVGAFAGNQLVQGLLMAEVLATVLICLWLLQGRRAPRTAVPFERWLLFLLLASLLSLASGFFWLDPTVPQQNVKLTVSIGQILLFAWPIGVYFVTANVVSGPAWTDRFSRAVLVLAIPQVAMLVWPELKQYLFWSWYFGLVAGPLALARTLFERSFWKKAFLCCYILPPLIEGVLAGKAFLYGYVLAYTIVILWMRARWVLLRALPLVGFLYAGVLLIPGTSAVPAPLVRLVEREEGQRSWGGRTGRVQLSADAMGIWIRYPLLGVGPANSYSYMLRYSVLGTPHSQYANLLLETGLIGLTLFVAFVLSALRFGLRALKVRRDARSDAFLLGWFGSFTALALVSLTGDYMLHSIRNAGLELFSGFYIHWVLLGAAVGLVRHETTVAARVPRAVPTVWHAPLDTTYAAGYGST